MQARRYFRHGLVNNSAPAGRSGNGTSGLGRKARIEDSSSSVDVRMGIMKNNVQCTR